MRGSTLARFALVLGVVALVAVMTASIGEAYYPGSVCAPVMRAPAPCPPPPMRPVVKCRPPAFPPPRYIPPPSCYPPPPCPPPRVCVPPPCPPPRYAPPCGPNPITALISGAVKLVAGVVTLPFRIVDRIFCGPSSPLPISRPRLACGPAMPYCPPPPMYGPPMGYPLAFGFGMIPSRPVGFGRGAPRRFVPMAKKQASPVRLVAESNLSVFGAYW